MCYGNGGQAYIYIVRNGGKTEAGSGGKRGKKKGGNGGAGRNKAVRKQAGRKQAGRNRPLVPVQRARAFFTNRD